MNMGVLTGEVSGIVALDIDGELGKRNLEELKSELGELPETVTVYTGGGGVHYYFGIPDGMEFKNSANQVIEKVDVRGNGGFVVGPGSMHHSGNFYEYAPGLDIASVPIVELPPAWAERIASPRKIEISQKGKQNSNMAFSEKAPSGSPYAGLSWQQTLETQLGDAEGGRGFHDPLGSATMKFYFQEGLNADPEIFKTKALLEIQRAACDHDRNIWKYTAEEIDRELESARRKVGKLKEKSRSKKTAAYGSKILFDLSEADTMSDRLRALRNTYAMAQVGSKTFVVKRPTPEKQYQLISGPDFERFFAGLFEDVVNADGEERRELLAKVFQQSMEHCIRYDGISFEPDESKLPEGHLNSWQGFQIKGVAGDWSRLKHHILTVWCDGDEELFEWVMDWFAHCIQCPGEKMGSAIVVRGTVGVGKSMPFDFFREVLGRYASKISNKRQLSGNFNGHFEGMIFIQFEEGLWGGERDAANLMKDMITSDKWMIEREGKDAFLMSNYSRFAFTTNEDWAAPIPMSGDSRRYLVLDASDTYKGDIEHFSAIAQQMKNGGLEAMMHELSTRQPASGNWSHLRTPPKTKALAAQRRHAFTTDQNTLISALSLGIIDGCDKDQNYFKYVLREDEETLVLKKHMCAVLQPGMDMRGGKGQDLWKNVRIILGEECTPQGKKMIDYITGSDGDWEEGEIASEREAFCIIPSLSELRQNLHDQFGITI